MGDDMLKWLRPLAADEQAMFDRHTALGVRDQPRLVIDQQSFDIDNAGRPWQRERAEWYRRQIAIALARMVAAETAALRAEVERLRDALMFYADENRNGYDVCPRDYGLSYDEGQIIKDAGDRARAALKGAANG